MGSPLEKSQKTYIDMPLLAQALIHPLSLRLLGSNHPTLVCIEEAHPSVAGNLNQSRIVADRITDRFR